MQPPVKGRGRPRRLSEDDVQKLLDGVMRGQFVGDGLTSKQSAAAQRGRAAKSEVIGLAAHEGIMLRAIVVRTWANDDSPEEYYWAIGCRTS
jgi:hypothetical protein